MFKRGVSPVVATVLLLVLTIVIGGVVFSAVIPFVKKSLSDSKMCLDLLEGVEFAESKFNCYNMTTPILNETGFSIRLKKEGISGFRVALVGSSGSSDVYDIKSGVTIPVMRMVGAGQTGYNKALEFPSVGGQRSYVVNKSYSKAELTPITQSGEICNLADTVEFTLCYKDVVL